MIPDKKNYVPMWSLDCLHCALNQVINTTEMVGMAEEQRFEIMQQALKTLGEKDIHRNNCEQIDEVYRLVTKAIGDEDPYRSVKAFFNTELMKLYPELKAHVDASDDPLRAAVRASIAGNLIDIAAFGNVITMEQVMEKLHQVDRDGLYADDVDGLDAALKSGKTLLVLGDNCGEIVLDKLLIETIRRLYPHIDVTYGVRGMPVVNDVTCDDAEMVGMQEVARVIDNGSSYLCTHLPDTSETFREEFYAADVIISKGMGNLESLFSCDRGNIWFLLIAKCRAVGKLTNSPVGSILAMQRNTAHLPGGV